MMLASENTTQTMTLPDRTLPSGSSPTRLAQRKCACGGAAGITDSCVDCGGFAIVDQLLRSQGQPLDQQTRAFMEPRFGHDFGKVRVHSDKLAAEAADAVGAAALTVGHDLIFGPAQFAPHTQAGKRLLAHELTHVVQQGRGATARHSDLRLNSPDDRFEQEADRVADHVLTNHETGFSGNGRVLPPLSVAPLYIQRKAKFVKSTPSEQVNPAEQIAENKIPEAELYLGQTNFLLNGVSFTGASNQAMIDALNKPQIGQASTTIPVGAEGKTIQGVECWFGSEPDNQGSYQMKLLKKGSWSHITEKKNVGGRFPSLKKCKDGFGDVTFVVKGEPKDSDLRDRVKAHEKQHADDDEAVFNDLLGAWDKKVTKAYNDKFKTKGPNLTVCEKALYSMNGKGPSDLVTNLAQGIVKKAGDFHQTDAGAKPSTQVENVDSDCTLVKVRTG